MGALNNCILDGKTKLVAKRHEVSGSLALLLCCCGVSESSRAAALTGLRASLRSLRACQKSEHQPEGSGALPEGSESLPVGGESLP